MKEKSQQFYNSVKVFFLNLQTAWRNLSPMERFVIVTVLCLVLAGELFLITLEESYKAGALEKQLLTEKHNKLIDEASTLKSTLSQQDQVLDNSEIERKEVADSNREQTELAESVAYIGLFFYASAFVVPFVLTFYFVLITQ